MVILRFVNWFGISPILLILLGGGIIWPLTHCDHCWYLIIVIYICIIYHFIYCIIVVGILLQPGLVLHALFPSPLCPRHIHILLLLFYCYFFFFFFFFFFFYFVTHCCIVYRTFFLLLTLLSPFIYLYVCDLYFHCSHLPHPLPPCLYFIPVQYSAIVYCTLYCVHRIIFTVCVCVTLIYIAYMYILLLLYTIHWTSPFAVYSPFVAYSVPPTPVYLVILSQPYYVFVLTFWLWLFCVVLAHIASRLLLHCLYHTLSLHTLLDIVPCSSHYYLPTHTALPHPTLAEKHRCHICWTCIARPREAVLLWALIAFPFLVTCTAARMPPTLHLLFWPRCSVLAWRAPFHCYTVVFCTLLFSYLCLNVTPVVLWWVTYSPLHYTVPHSDCGTSLYCLLHY